MRIGGARTQLSDPRSHAFIVLIRHHWWGEFLRWAEGLHGPVFCYPVGRLGRHLEENPHSQDITLGDINSPWGLRGEDYLPMLQCRFGAPSLSVGLN